jgi:multiple sugar transport system substrate-binding protein
MPHRKSPGFLFPFASALTLALASSTALDAQDKEFQGIELSAMIRTGPVLAKRVAERAKEFGEKTGARITVVESPPSDLFQKLVTDWSTGTNSIDIGFYQSGWMADLAGSGFLEDLSPYVAKDAALKHDDIAPFFREFNQKFGGKTYSLTIDGDFHLVYYRTDVLKDLGMEPPRTWDEYLKIAAAANGKDLNGDGVADYGSCLFKKRNAISYWVLLSIASGHLQSKGTEQGMFFDKKTMKPLVNNPAFIRALNIYKETGKYGPPDELNHDIGATRGLFLAGRSALTIDWGDIGPLAIDETQSKVKGRVGAIILPGSKEVLNRETGKLEACNAELSPYAENGINRAPYAAFGGWSGGINAKINKNKKQAAYAFLSYLSQPEQSNIDVTIGWTGMNPYRVSQTSSVDPWVAAGFSKEAAKDYLGAINATLNSPNMASDLRIPGAAQYQGTVLDRELARFLAGQISAEETASAIEAGWEEITEDFGREEQRELYLSGLTIKN